MWFRWFALGLLLFCRVATAAGPERPTLADAPLTMDARACPTVDHAGLLRLLSIELHTQVIAAANAQPSAEHIALRCAEATVDIRVEHEDDQAPLARRLDLAPLAARAHLRFIALAITELVTDSRRAREARPSEPVKTAAPASRKDTTVVARVHQLPAHEPGLAEGLGVSTGLRFHTTHAAWLHGLGVLGQLSLGEHWGLRIGLQAERGRDTLDLGSGALSSYGALCALSSSARRQRWSGHIDLGMRGGLAHIEGRSDDPSVVADGVSGAWAGVLAGAGLAWSASRRLIVGAQLELGLTAAALVGTTRPAPQDRPRRTGLAGPWLGTTISLLYRP